MDEKVKNEPIVLTAELDDGSIGMKRKRFVFPTGIKSGFDRMTHPSITGCVYVEEGRKVPEEITIKFNTVR